MSQSLYAGLSHTDKDAVIAKKEALPESVRIGLAASKDSRGEAFSAFCEELKTLVPQVMIKKEDLLANGLPFLKISDRIRYHCIPREKELPLFLDLLADADFQPPAVNAPSMERIASVSAPAFLKVYIAPLCPFCPKTVSDLFWLAGQSRLIHITIIDGEFFPMLTEQDRIRSVPTVILDNDLRWVGQVDLDEIVGMMVERDPSRLGPDALRSMIEEGGAGDLAGMMTAQEKIFPALMDLLTHSQWSVRLGAMAVFEYLVENSPRLAGQLLDLLWERFEGADDPVKGDILYLMGQADHAQTPDRLAKVIAGPYGREVKEAAEEALEAVQGDE